MTPKRKTPETRKMVVAIAVSLLVIVVVSGLYVLYRPEGGVVGKAITLQNGCAVVGPSEGLVAWWEGEGDALDSSGNENNGNAVEVTFVAGKVGNAFQFDGTNDYIYALGNPFNFGTQQAFTIEGFVKTTDDLGAIVAKWGSSNVGYRLLLTSGSLTLDLGGTTTVTKSSVGTINDGTWRHIAVTYDGNGIASGIKLYINGLLQQTTGSVPQDAITGSISNNEPLIIGKSGSFVFAGTIDELSIYDRELSSTDISAIATAGESGKCLAGENNADIEDCTTSADDDGDGDSNCFDSDCFSNPSCQNEDCLITGAKTVAWSYLLPTDQDALDAGTVPTLFNCCKPNECAATVDVNVAGNCLGLNSLDSAGNLCDSDRNWHDCTEALQGTKSSDGAYECNEQEWEVVCQQSTKYKLRSTVDPSTDFEEICDDGSQWRTCASLAVSPILDLSVAIQCTVAGKVTIQEVLCNNGEDDDNNGKADYLDPDCTPTNGILTYIMNNANRYQVNIKATDPFKVTIN